MLDAYPESMNPDPKRCWQALEFSRRNSVEMNCRMNNVVHAGWDIIARTTGSTGSGTWRQVQYRSAAGIACRQALGSGMPGKLSKESQIECMPAGSGIWRQVVIVEVLDKLLNLEAEFLEKRDEPVLYRFCFI